MGKKDRSIFDDADILPEAKADETAGETAVQAEAPAEEQKKKTRGEPKDYEWDLADTRYNIGEKVYRHGEVMPAVKTDGNGAPKDPALKRAYELGYMKEKE